MRYYAFKGKKRIAGPFKNRLEAKDYGKPGHKCRVCEGNAGGSSICYACILVAFNGMKRDRRL